MNYNPADFFIQTLAIQPGLEEVCLKNVNHICDSFEKSEAAQEIQNVCDYFLNSCLDFYLFL